MSKAEPRAGARSRALPRNSSKSGGRRKKSHKKSHKRPRKRPRTGSKKTSAKTSKKGVRKKAQRKSQKESKGILEPVPELVAELVPEPETEPTAEPRAEPSESKAESRAEPTKPVVEVATAAERVMVLWTGQHQPEGKVLEEVVAAVRCQHPGSDPFVTTGGGSSLRGQLTGARCSTLVLAGLPPEEFLSVRRRFRWRLVDALRAGVQQFGFLCMDGNYLVADRQQVLADLLGVFGTPYVGWRVATSLWHTPEDAGEDPILSFGGKVNDWMASFARAR